VGIRNADVDLTARRSGRTGVRAPGDALYYITRLAREHVKVLISGEGGDEAFARYQNYRNVVWLERLKSIGESWTGMTEALISGLGRMKPLSRFVKYSPLMHVPLGDYYYSRTSRPFSLVNQLSTGSIRRISARKWIHVGGSRTSVNALPGSLASRC